MNIPTVAEVMSSYVISFKADWSAARAARKLLEKRFSGAPVVDDSDHVIGVLSEADCIRDLHNLLYNSTEGRTVGELMSTTIITIRPEADLLEACETLLSQRIRRLPVVDAQGKLIGILTRGSVFRFLSTMAGECQRV
jgi:CBS domain-containing protein